MNKKKRRHTHDHRASRRIVVLRAVEVLASLVEHAGSCANCFTEEPLAHLPVLHREGSTKSSRVSWSYKREIVEVADDMAGRRNAQDVFAFDRALAKKRKTADGRLLSVAACKKLE